MGRTEFLTCKQITREPWLEEQKQKLQLSGKEMGAWRKIGQGFLHYT